MRGSCKADLAQSGHSGLKQPQWAEGERGPNQDCEGTEGSRLQLEVFWGQGWGV